MIKDVESILDDENKLPQVKLHVRTVWRVKRAMFSGTFKYITSLDHHIDEVWSFFNNANNLVTISSYPKVSLQANPSTVKGDCLHLVLNFGLFRLNWLLVIQEVQERSYFVDEAIRIPFPLRAWRHTHSFIQQGDLTVMQDKIEFEAYVPAFIVGILLRRMFKDRERAIKKLLGLTASYWVRN